MTDTSYKESFRNHYWEDEGLFGVRGGHSFLSFFGGETGAQILTIFQVGGTPRSCQILVIKNK